MAEVPAAALVLPAAATAPAVLLLLAPLRLAWLVPDALEPPFSSSLST